MLRLQAQHIVRHKRVAAHVERRMFWLSAGGWRRFHNDVLVSLFEGRPERDQEATEQRQRDENDCGNNQHHNVVIPKVHVNDDGGAAGVSAGCYFPR